MELELMNFANLDAAFKKTVEKHMPLKQKIVRNNYAPFLTKRLRKKNNDTNQKKKRFQFESNC